MTGLLPESGVRLNPDAAQPPFTWHVALPDAWTMLDLHPATWQRSLGRVVDERFAGLRLKAAGRRHLWAELEDLVSAAQRGGVLLSLVQIGLRSGGGPASAGLNVAWYDSAPLAASLSLARQAIGRQGVTDEVVTEAGRVLLHRDHLMMASAGSATRVGVTSLQAFLPLSGRTWTAVVATSSAHPEMTDLLRDLVLATAGSIRPVEPEPGDQSGVAAPGDAGAPEEYAPIPKPDQPGIERGFGTMVVRRIPPPESR